MATLQSTCTDLWGEDDSTVPVYVCRQNFLLKHQKKCPGCAKLLSPSATHVCNKTQVDNPCYGYRVTALWPAGSLSEGQRSPWRTVTLRQTGRRADKNLEINQSHWHGDWDGGVRISLEPIKLCGRKTEAVATDANVKRMRVCGEACQDGGVYQKWFTMWCCSKNMLNLIFDAKYLNLCDVACKLCWISCVNKL